MGNERCKRCIMPAEYPGITFDSEGVCNYCTQDSLNIEANKSSLLGKEKLIEFFRSAERGGGHDCVIPLSGGKDSTYVLYYAVKELGLKPVAVTYDSGFRTQIAKENVDNSCNALNVPCIVVEDSKRIQNRLLSDALRISERLGSFVLTCMNCGTLIKAIPVKVAKQKRIPFVLFGDSARESIRLMKLRSKLKSIDYREMRSHRVITIMTEKLTKLREVNMTPLKLMRILPRLLRYRFLGAYRLLSLGVPLRNAIFPNTGSVTRKKGPQMIHFYDYVDWNPTEDIAVLEKELGWKHPPDRISRFDCLLNCFGSYDTLQKGGISGNGVIACNLIREGLRSRDEALETERLAEHTVVQECRRVMSDLGIDDFVLPALRNHRLEGDRTLPDSQEDV